MKLHVISVSIFVWKGPFSFEYALTLQICFANCLYHALHYETTPPTPRQKKGQNHYQPMGKKLQLTVGLCTGGSPLVAVFKVPRGHSNSTRATQANLQLRCVTVINIRCLSSLLSPLKKHVWLGPNIFGLFYKKKHARVQEILS